MGVTATMTGTHAAVRPERMMAALGCLLIIALAGSRLWPDLQRVLGVSHVGAGNHITAMAEVLLLHLRLPRVFSALLAGAALGISGLLFQSGTRNALASPDLLGVTAGAQIGVLAAMTLPWLSGNVTPPLLFACGLAAAAIAGIAAGGYRATPLRLLLAGSACTLFFTAITTMLLVLNEQSTDGVALWSSGSLYQPGGAGVVSAGLWMLLPLAALPLLLRPLDVLALGDDAAATLGIAPSAIRMSTLAAAVGFAAVAVSIAGPIGFIGLLAPNMLRACRVFRLRWLLPLSALWGAVLLLVSDSLLLASGLEGNLFTGIVVAMVGTPLLLVLIHRGGMLAAPQPQGGNEAHGHGNLRMVLVVLGGGVLMLYGLAMAAGAEGLSPSRWWRAWQGLDPIAATLLDLRLPRATVAAFGGALLAASGLLLQSVVRNPLAGPDLLGINQGAGLATLAALSMWPAVTRGGMFAAALAGGAIVLCVTLACNRKHRYAPLPVSLTGIALGALCTSLAQWVVVQQNIHPAQSVIWLAGGTYGRSWEDVAAIAPWFVLALPALLLLMRPLDMLALGDDNAAALGVPVTALRVIALALATVLASTVVAVVGPIAFVGLMTPHIARLLGFGSHRHRLPVAMLLGAAILMAADILGRTLLAPREIPAGVLTALFGAPYFVWLMIGQARREKRGG